jgi:hypothetical protein
MILADVARGCIVLIPVGVAFFQPVSLWLLIATAIAVGGLKPFFDPALYALIPRLVQDQRLRQATNGLIDVTPRVARILGPAMVSVLHQCLPILHFLTLDAMTFFLSALAIWRVKRALRDDAPTPAQVANSAGGVRAILDMFYSVAGFPLMQFLVYGHAVASSAWYLGFILSTALLLHERMPDQIGSYGLVLASYGIGNVASTVLVANLVITRAVRFMFMGRLIAGLSFVGFAYAPDVATMIGLACLGACGAPMHNLPFLGLLQAHFAPVTVARVYRLRLMAERGCICIALLVSPVLFAHFPISSVIAGCGVLILAVGVGGLTLFSEHSIKAVHTEVLV